ncbi:hypothetical protein Hanom_Chr10g00903471 [Helianthus anomalus]
MNSIIIYHLTKELLNHKSNTSVPKSSTIMKNNQFLKRATRDRSIEDPINTPETGTEKAAPASGEGAGAVA